MLSLLLHLHHHVMASVISLLLHLHHHVMASVMALLSLPALHHMLGILFTPPLAGCHIDACHAHDDMLPSQRSLLPQWQGLTLKHKGISLPSAASASHVASASHFGRRGCHLGALQTVSISFAMLLQYCGRVAGFFAKRSQHCSGCARHGVVILQKTL